MNQKSNKRVNKCLLLSIWAFGGSVIAVTHTGSIDASNGLVRCSSESIGVSGGPVGAISGKIGASNGSVGASSGSAVAPDGSVGCSSGSLAGLVVVNQ